MVREGDQPQARPGADAGYAACLAASTQTPAAGNVGAGAGACVGKLFGLERCMKGGIGNASVRVGPWVVGALVACNAVGDVIEIRLKVGRWPELDTWRWSQVKRAAITGAEVG
jgi:L-aminopeptidase/D-esterase-like protein